MVRPVLVHLDDAVKQALAAEAKAQGRSLSSLLCLIAAEAAARLRRARIREESESVGSFVAHRDSARRFIDSLGRPPA